MKYLVVRHDWNSSGFFDTPLGLIEEDDVEALAHKLLDNRYEGSLEKFKQGKGTFEMRGNDEEWGEDCGHGYYIKPYEPIKLEELLRREGMR